jgi:hypothetical protein
LIDYLGVPKVKTTLFLMTFFCALNTADAQTTKLDAATQQSPPQEPKLLTPKQNRKEPSVRSKLPMEVAPPNTDARPFKGPKINEGWILPSDSVGGLSLESLVQWCRASNNEFQQDRSGPFSNKFIDRTVARSKGQLVKLSAGTRVRILARERTYAKIQIDEGSHRGETYYISSVLLDLGEGY